MRIKSDAISQAKAAFARISKQGSKLVEDWTIVANGLKAGRDLHKSDTDFGRWLRENLPDLAGQPYASTRKSALWLLTEDGARALQWLKSESTLNHSVAIEKAWRKHQAEEAASKVGLVSLPAPQAPATASTSSHDEEGHDDEALVAVLMEGAKAGTEPTETPSAPARVGFLARYTEGGKVNRDLLNEAWKLLEDDVEKAADMLCEMPREDLQRMSEALHLALTRHGASKLALAA